MAKPGRPRSFDKQKALDAALQVFWRKGYEGAWLAELTSAMGIEKPSMYAAFGDRRSTSFANSSSITDASMRPTCTPR